jgi:phosphate transport system substrate-binding protein
MIFCSCGKQGQGNTAPAETTGAETTGTDTAGAAAGTTAAAASETTAGETAPEKDLPEKTEEKVIEAPQIKAADFPVTDGSTATLPLAWMLYRLCTGEDQAAAEKAMSFTKTNNAYIRLMDKEADLVIAYEPGPNAAADPRFKDLELKPIGLDALVFLCNTENPVQSLTSAQRKYIYTGKIRNWEEVGG